MTGRMRKWIAALCVLAMLLTLIPGSMNTGSERVFAEENGESAEGSGNVSEGGEQEGNSSEGFSEGVAAPVVRGAGPDIEVDLRGRTTLDVESLMSEIGEDNWMNGSKPYSGSWYYMWIGVYEADSWVSITHFADWYMPGYGFEMADLDTVIPYQGKVKIDFAFYYDDEWHDIRFSNGKTVIYLMDSTREKPHYDLKFTVQDGEAKVVSFEDDYDGDGNVVIPEKVVLEDPDSGNGREKEYPVTGILQSAFEGDTRVKTLSVKNSASALLIGEGAFRGCGNLTEVTIEVNGQVTVGQSAFENCTALESLEISEKGSWKKVSILADAFKKTGLHSVKIATGNSEVAQGAFADCTSMNSVIFTGKGSQDIATGAFSGTTPQYVRIDNPYNMANGTLQTNGKYFVQNNDAPLNTTRSDTIGTFDMYIFADNPWWINSNAFSGSNAPRVIYIANPNKNLSSGFVSAIQNAGPRLTDVYIDSAREDVSFADNLDSANSKVRIHYRKHLVPNGLYLDGNGNDETGDGTRDNPYRTFEKARAIWENQEAGEERYVDNNEITDNVTAAYSALGVNATPGEFITVFTGEMQVVIKGTVNVSGNETWENTTDREMVIYRDPDFTGAMVQVGGTLTLRNVVLDGNRSAVTAEAPVISVTSGGVLNLESGAVIRNNSFPQSKWGDGNQWLNGGGVYARSATVNINGGRITGNLAMYGGGIQMYGGTLNMDSGSIDGNTAMATTYANNVKVNGNGGGVLLIQGAVMNLRGGEVSGNRADGITSSGIGINGSTGGGIQVGAAYNDLYSNSQLFMSGGSVSNNTAYAQGGGIFINAACTATVTAGSITGNTSGRGEFGGGGFYVNGGRSGCNVNGVLKLYNVLITDNEAYRGGGIANCETVHLSIHVGNGSAIYGNTGGDLFLFLRQTGVGTKASIADMMMNRSPYHWTYEDGTPVPADLLAYFDAGRWSDTTLVSHPENTDVSGQVRVRITGNKAATYGGGIGSNGDVIIGDIPSSNEVIWTPEVTKVVYGRDLKEGEEITFTVLEEHRKDGAYYWNMEYGPDTVAGTGKVTGTKDGVPAKISFTPISLGVRGAGDVGKVAGYFIVLEDPNPNEELQTDEHNYLIYTVQIGTAVVDGKEQYVGAATIIQKGTYTRDEDGNIVYDTDRYGARDRDDIRAYYEEKYVGSQGFVNHFIKTSIPAKKVWVDKEGNETNPPEGATVTFELYADGRPTGKTIVLDGKTDDQGETEPWTALWTGLDTYQKDDDGAYVLENGAYVPVTYTVKETAATPDYIVISTAEYAAGEEPAEITNTVPEGAGSLTLPARKTVNGKAPSGEEVFSFTLSAEGSAPLKKADGTARTDEELTVKNNGEEITFPTLFYTLDDVRTEPYVYTVREEGTDRNGYTIDTTVYTVEVTVSAGDTAKGTLKIEKVILTGGEPAEEILFNNTYVEETPTPTPEVTPTPTPTPTPEPLTEATVRKVWVDNGPNAGTRPASLTMHLSNGMSVTLNAANGWSATIPDLPVYDANGQEINYTWTEDEVMGYQQTGKVRNGTVTTFTNTRWTPPEEPPADAGNPPRTGQTWTIFEEYDTPLGVEVIINHVGDCFD